MWLDEYAPETLRLVEENLRVALSRNERGWVAKLQEVFPGGVPPRDRAAEAALRPLAHPEERDGARAGRRPAPSPALSAN